MAAQIFNFFISLEGMNREKLLEIGGGGENVGLDCSADIL